MRDFQASTELGLDQMAMFRVSEGGARTAGATGATCLLSLLSLRT